MALGLTRDVGFHCPSRVRSYVGVQWELPGAVERETGAILSLSGCGRGILTPPRRRAFWPDRSPPCAFSGRSGMAVFRLPFPRYLAPFTFSASPSGRPSVSCASQARRPRGCSRGRRSKPCSSESVSYTHLRAHETVL